MLVNELSSEPVEVTPDMATSDDLVAELAKYGALSIFYGEGGWNAILEVFVIGEGVGFEIRTDFGMANMKDALSQLKYRFRKQISELNQLTKEV